MAKKKNKFAYDKEYERIKNEPEDVYNKNIVEAPIDVMCEEYSKIFASNVNILRQIPWIASGLKINETRILYNLYLMKAFPNKERAVKCKTLIGNVAVYHPHGDSSIEQSIGNISQPWKVNCPLIDMSGNRGTSSGGDLAAPRYLDCRMSKYAYDCFFQDYDEAVIDFKPSFTGEYMEPEFVLPARYPHVLMNNSYSICQGVSSAIFPCNFNEALDLTIRLIQNPNIPTEECILYPDSPTGCDIIDDGNFKDICINGTGSYRMQGRVEIDEERNELHIFSTPLFTTLYKVIEQLLELKNNKVLDIVDIETYSTKDDFIHQVIKLKKGVDPYKALQIIFNKTSLRLSKHINFKLIDSYSMIDYSLKGLILNWIDFRRDYMRRIKNHELNNKREKMHLLEAILLIFKPENYKTTMARLTKSKNKDDIIKFLMSTFDITSIQAATIAGMRLYRFSKESLEKYKEEAAKLRAEIPELEDLIKYKEKIDAIIIEQLKDGMEKYGKPRKSRIIKIKKNQRMIKDSTHLLILTEAGYIKKLADGSNKIGAIKEGDVPIDCIQVDNSDVLVIFDAAGQVAKINVSDIPVNDTKAFGHLAKSLVEGLYEDIVSLQVFKSEAEIKASKNQLVFITKNGIGKRIDVKELSTIRKAVKCISVKDDDMLRVVKIIKKPVDLVIYSTDGYGVRVNSNDIREASKTAMGSVVYRLRSKAEVIGAEEISAKDKGMMIITSKGNAKLCELANFPLAEDYKPLILIKVGGKEVIEVVKCVKGKEQFSIMMKSGVFNLAVEELGKPQPRLARGTKIVPMRKGDKIISIK